MDKSVGTVVQFKRFFTNVKLYSRATNTAHPYPLPPPHGQCNIALGEEGGGDMDL